MKTTTKQRNHFYPLCIAGVVVASVTLFNSCKKEAPVDTTTHQYAGTYIGVSSTGGISGTIPDTVIIAFSPDSMSNLTNITISERTDTLSIYSGSNNTYDYYATISADSIFIPFQYVSGSSIAAVNGFGHIYGQYLTITTYVTADLSTYTSTFTGKKQ